MTATADPDALARRRRWRRPNRRPGAARKRRTFWVLAGLFLLATCVLSLAPFIWTAMSVTKPTNVAFANPPVFIYTPTFQAFVDLWQTTYFYQYLVNTLIVAVHHHRHRPGDRPAGGVRAVPDAAATSRPSC